MGWDARMRYILFWHKILTGQQYHHRLVQRLAHAALRAQGRGQWMGKLRTCLEAFGWRDYSCATLAEVSGGQLREMLRSVACKCVEKDWAEDLGSKSKCTDLVGGGGR